jgi:hypothetical protein
VFSSDAELERRDPNWDWVGRVSRDIVY